MPFAGELRIKNQAGTVVDRRTDWIRFEWAHRVNSVGWCILEVEQNSPVAPLLTPDDPDFQIELYRYNTEVGIVPYLEWEGFFRTPNPQTRQSGQPLFVAYGRNYLDLVARSAILYPAGNARTTKSAPGETAIKEFVNENAGPAALAASSRLRDHVFSGLSIQADGAAGGTWDGSRALQALLPVIQAIGEETDVDFELVGTGPATFQFNAKASPLGADRTTAGVAPGTGGLNGAGNVPVVFSQEFGNVEQPSYIKRRTEERNVVAVLGQGVEADREIVIRTSATLTDSPWNDIEFVRQASQLSLTAALNSLGDEEIVKNQAREEIGFRPLQEDDGAFLYGRDYFIGDLVTARYVTPGTGIDITVDKKIIGVRGLQRAGDRASELITLELGDIS